MVIYWDRKVPECTTCSLPYQSLPHLAYYNLAFVTLSLLVWLLDFYFAIIYLLQY